MRQPISRRSAIRTLAGATASVGLPLLSASAESTKSAQGRDEQYASDYISFVGNDDAGEVFFAIDNNRGRTGNKYFADHWGTMYDAKQGWVRIEGFRHYENTERTLTEIPPSEFFQFAGAPETGLSFKSAQNDLAMQIGSLRPDLLRKRDEGRFWVGAADARMTWKGRQITGRVIYEKLERNDWNRFTNSFEKNWKNFNGFYLRDESGTDFYMHSHERKGGSDLTGKLVGLATWGTPAPISDLDFKVTKSVEADGGQFRWPTEWTIGFSHAGKSYVAALTTRVNRDVAWWKTGGFMMSIVDGEIRGSTGDTRRVTGWGELLI